MNTSKIEFAPNSKAGKAIAKYKPATYEDTLVVAIQHGSEADRKRALAALDALPDEQQENSAITKLTPKSAPRVNEP